MGGESPSPTQDSAQQFSPLTAVAVAGASFAAVGCAAVLWHRCRRALQRGSFPGSLVPLIEFMPGGTKAKRIERFGEYVVRQLGIPPGETAAALVAQAADDYILGDKSRSDKSRENLLALAAMACSRTPSQGHEERVRLLTGRLIDELDTCMLAYFGFHWRHSSLLIQQVFKIPHEKLKLKDVVQAVMREQRQKKAVAQLRAQQRISMLLQELRLLGRNGNSSTSSSSSSSSSSSASPSLTSSHTSSPALSLSSSPSSSSSASSLRSVASGNLLVPLEAPKRCPVLLMIGGGMGAGKSTVVREIMKRCFWSKVAYDAVVVEADAFKEKDVIFRALSSDAMADMASVAQLVHEESTRAASSTLVTALNEGRDVIFDGTMSWEPFVRQTIEMARDVHLRRYRLGPGYVERPDGTVQEQYWEPVETPSTCIEEEVPSEWDMAMDLLGQQPRRPYRIEFVGVMCDVHLAVVRGMRRAILTKRGVPVDGQLRSHVLFARAVEEYCSLVDQSHIYSTNDMGGPPRLIAMREKRGNLLVDPSQFGMVEEIKQVNTSATSALELYRQPSLQAWLPLPLPMPLPLSLIPFLGVLLGERPRLGPGEAWHSRVMAQGRKQRQEELRRAFMEIQVCLWPKSGTLPTSSTSFRAAPSSIKTLSELNAAGTNSIG